MKKMTALLLALCLLLCGCSNWMDSSYVSVTPHLENSPGVNQEMITVSSYMELRNALTALVEDGAESATIDVEAFDEEKADSNMAMAIRYVTRSNPIGAYAVESIDYELGTTGGVSAVAVNITYLHNRAEIRRIKRVSGMEQAAGIITDALEQCEAGIVFLVDGYVKTDFAQLIQDYGDEHPETVMEVPELTANIYPESGIIRVVELKFTYQTNRDSLRTMQSKVQNVFASAKLYVTEDGSDYEKYSQLFAFLTNRFDYRLETSITPSYSLLCHGVGDSKAIAVCFAAMCRQSGLECLVVSGTRAGEPWFWNIILDEDTYYHLDLIQASRAGGFRELTDRDMEGYVWDYSAYPACVEIYTEEPTQEPPVEPTEEATIAPEDTMPTESTAAPTDPADGA